MTREERLHRKSIVTELTYQHNSANQSPDSGTDNTAFPKSYYRSRSEEEVDTSMECSVQQHYEDQSLEDVQEDPESSDSETANEVEVSEKALKFKISTDYTAPNTGRKSYPGSRKGSRERGQHLNHSDLTRIMQPKGKHKFSAYSFDHNYLSDNKKLSSDSQNLLDEYTIILNKNIEQRLAKQQDKDNSKEYVLSKDALNLIKKKSINSVKVPASLDEKKSILKYSDNKTSLNVDNLKISIHSAREEVIIKTGPKYNTIIKKFKYSDSKDNDISITSPKKDTRKATDEIKSTRSIFSRFRQFADKFGLSQDLKIKPAKNNNCAKSSPYESKKMFETSCCISLKEVDSNKASTLPKATICKGKHKSWKSFHLGKEKSWYSEAAAVKTLDGNFFSVDNHFLPSTSQINSNCATPNKVLAPIKSLQSFPRNSLVCDSLDDTTHTDPIESNVVDKCRVTLQEIKNGKDQNTHII